MGCGNIDPLVGGTIVQSTITQSTITGSSIINSSFDSGTVTNLVSVDEGSTRKILDAICALSQSDLQKLADALQPLLTASTTQAPDSDSYDYLPDTLYGTSTALLAKPDQWLEIGGMRVPAYD